MDTETREMMTEDILSILVQENGPVPVGVVQAGLRGSYRNAYHYPESGRRWRSLGARVDFKDLLESLGFTLKFAGRCGGGNKIMVDY